MENRVFTCFGNADCTPKNSVSARVHSLTSRCTASFRAVESERLHADTIRTLALEDITLCPDKTKGTLDKHKKPITTAP